MPPSTMDRVRLVEFQVSPTHSVLRSSTCLPQLERDCRVRRKKGEVVGKSGGSRVGRRETETEGDLTGTWSVDSLLLN